MNILIIYGGKSCEHDISIITACLARGYFKGNLYSAYFDKTNKCFLVPNNFTPAKHLDAKLNQSVSFCLGEGQIVVQKGKFGRKKIPIDVAVNCCHGVNGEDGSIAGLCQLAQIPLVGSDILSSSIAMDKGACKRFLKSFGFPVVRGKVITKGKYLSYGFSVGNLGYPVIIKPCSLGSSIGISRCENATQLKNALNKAFTYDDKVLCERALKNFYEVNCSVMKADGKVLASDVDNPTTMQDILTFEDKYLQNSKWSKPAVNLDLEVVEQAQNISKAIYEKLKFSGVIRVDYLVDKSSGKVFVNEINAIPGSLAYGLWSNLFTTEQFGNILIKQALDDYSAKSSLVRMYSSSVLQGQISKK